MNKFFVVGEWFRMMRKFKGFESEVGDAREYKRAGGKKRNPQKNGFRYYARIRKLSSSS